MDMRFYWVQDQIRQVHQNVFWKPGATNLDEYFTKTIHLTIIAVCAQYIYTVKIMQIMQV